MSEKIKQEDYNAQVFTKTKENHLWISAFRCIRPTDELKISIGEWVLDLLKDQESLLPAEYITSDNQTMRELAGLTPILYLSVNKS